MENSSKILSGAGLIKISLPSSRFSNDKIRLYSFSDQTPEGIAKVQTLFSV